MAGLSSPGLGSGLDINSLVTKLMSVEQLPLVKLQKDEASYQAKLSAYGQLQGYLSSFQTAVRGLTSPTQFNMQRATTSDANALSAVAGSGASTGTHSLDIQTLAQSQTLRTNVSYASTSSSVGTGTLTIDFGSYTGGAFSQNAAKGTQTITIAAGQDSLAAVRNAINGANAGVSASIINDGSGFRLLLSSSETGSSNALRIVAGSGLAALAYDASTGGTSNLIQAQAAQDATFTVDGVGVTKATNTVTDVIEGVTLSLKSTGASTVAIAPDTTGVQGSIVAFVKAFNDTSQSLKSLTAYNAEKKQGGILLGDATALSIASQLRSVLNRSLTNANGGLKTLSDLGVSFQKNGTLSIDYSKLNGVLSDPSKDVATLFAAVGKPTDALVRFTNSATDTVPGNYAVRVKQIAAQGSVAATAAQGISTTVGSGNNGLSLAVNGVATSINLANGDYSNAGLLAMVQAAINGNTTLAAGGNTVTASMSGTQGRITGNAAAGLIISAANNTIDVTIDGTTVNGITLTDGTYTATTLAAELQSKINSDSTFAAAGLSVAVTQANGILTVQSNRYGATSAVDISGTAGATSLLGTTPTISVGTGTATISLTSDRYGAISNVNITGGTAAADLFGAAIVSGTPGHSVAGSIFDTTGFTHAYLTGSLALSGSQVVDGTNNALSVVIDGTTANITLTAGTYTTAQLATEIQTAINGDTGLAAAGISVATSLDSSGRLVITSNDYGTASSVSVTGGSAATAFIGTATATAGTGTVTPLAQGYATGSIALSGSQTITAGSNDNLSVTIDGNTATVTLDAGTYSVAQLAVAIQDKINADAALGAAGRRVAVSVDLSGQLVVTSQSYGPTSSASVNSGTAAVDFFGTTTSTAGTGTATGFGQNLTAANGGAKGMRLEVAGGIVGTRGTVAFDQGFAYRLDQAINNLLGSSGTIVSRTDGITRSIQDIASRRDVLNRRLTNIEARYRQQFNALDALVSRMQQTSTYLQQQLTNLSNLNRGA